MNEVDSPPQTKTAEPAGPAKPAARKAANRRMQERVPANSPILICCEDRQGTQRRIRARAIDMSKSGILLQSEEPVSTGAVVCLRTIHLAFIGRACVRHCTQKGMKYRLGLYVPDRLLRLEQQAGHT
jgi:PilZ domain-containing protein